MSNTPCILRSGSTLGRYDIVRPLTVGGMAEIYLARASGIEGWKKLCVLKRLLPEHAARPHFLKMFHDEARLAALLQHQNIVHVYDVGNDKGPFIAMEYIHGESVQKLIAAAKAKRRSIPIDQAITIVLGVCAGLHHAHEKRGPDGRPLGIVHRDVSSSNVLLGYDGGIKLIDFGVAKAERRETESAPGTLKGKFGYMSPEQCRAMPLDRRSDVFSVGALLYELVCGQRPFEAANDYDVLSKIVSADPRPPSKLRKSVTPRLERLILRALSRDRRARFRTAQEMQLELETLALEERRPTSPVALAAFVEELTGKKGDPTIELETRLESPSPAATETPIVSLSMVVEVEDQKDPPRRARRSRVAALALGGLALLLGGWALGDSDRMVVQPIVTPVIVPAAPAPPPAMGPPPPPDAGEAQAATASASTTPPRPAVKRPSDRSRFWSASVTTEESAPASRR